MFKHPFSFDGRIRRTEYGVTFIIYVILYVIALTLIQVGGTGGSILGLLLLIPMIWFVWAQGAKRCHDVGKSGWWQLIPFYFFVLLFQDGVMGSNAFGQNPKNPQQEDVLASETLDGHLR